MKAEAGKVGESVSGYLVGLHEGRVLADIFGDVPDKRESIDAPSKSVSRRLSVQKKADEKAVEPIVKKLKEFNEFFKPNPKKKLTKR